MAAIVVGGALANKAGSGGEAWVRMSWVRGLAQLGHDVSFLEQLPTHAEPDGDAVDWFRDVAERFGVTDRATLLHGDDVLAGPSLTELARIAPTAHLVNISGHVDHARLFGAFASRVLVDIDPGFTQFWHAAGLAGARVAGHDRCFTIGELIGTRQCPVPTAGVDWRPTRQPVVLDDWPHHAPTDDRRYTTVSSWRPPFGAIVHDGTTYGLKVHEFRKIWDLPLRTRHRFELALQIYPGDEADRQALLERGWELTDPIAAAGSPDAFAAYVAASGAEFSVAQGVYVGTQCGWFSDRTVRYLASGRPALVQDTGFGAVLPTGLGLVPFRTLDDAVVAADDIVDRYDEHAVAARQIADRHFAADVVLAKFCADAGIL